MGLIIAGNVHSTTYITYYYKASDLCGVEIENKYIHTYNLFTWNKIEPFLFVFTAYYDNIRWHEFLREGYRI